MSVFLSADHKLSSPDRISRCSSEVLSTAAGSVSGVNGCLRWKPDLMTQPTAVAFRFPEVRLLRCSLGFGEAEAQSLASWLPQAL